MTKTSFLKSFEEVKEELFQKCLLAYSSYKEQETVDFEKRENTPLQIHGRHDPAIIHRARVVVDSAVAIALCDLLVTRFGTDWLTEKV